MHNDEDDRCDRWSDTLRSLEFTNQVQPVDQGVRLQGGWHLSRVSAYNQFFCKQCHIEAQAKNLPIRFNLVCKRGIVHCREPIEVLSYKIGVCKVARYDYNENDDHDHDHERW